MRAGFFVLLVVSDAPVPPPIAEMNPLFYFVTTNKLGCKDFTCLTVSTATLRKTGVAVEASLCPNLFV